MRKTLLSVFLVAIAFTPKATPSFAEPSAQQTMPQVSEAQMQLDMKVLEDTLRTLHPALDRYGEEEEFWGSFEDLKSRIGGGQSLQAHYLNLSKLVVSAGCGHTYLNPYNLSKDLRAKLIDTQKSVPFLFDLAGDRMVITASADPNVRKGDEILSIDGQPVTDLLTKLSPFVKGDGGRTEPKLYNLQVKGVSRYEPFDIYFPLTREATSPALNLEVIRSDGTQATLSVPAMTRTDRLSVLADQGLVLARKPDETWSFDVSDAGVAYFKAGSFVTWNMDMDWEAFIDKAYADIKTTGAHTLILDIRGNGGGMPIAAARILSGIADRSFTRGAVEERVAMQQVPDHLREHLGTWDQSFYDWADRTTPNGNGQFIVAGDAPQTVPVNPDAFTGRVILLIDRANSSATFTMAQVLKDSGRAILVGEETGGNQKGITGGAILFLTLPGSGIEVDMPLIGYFPKGAANNAGVIPDFTVVPTIEDIRAGKDTVLDYAYSLAKSPRH